MLWCLVPWGGVGGCHRDSLLWELRSTGEDRCPLEEQRSGAGCLGQSQTTRECFRERLGRPMGSKPHRFRLSMFVSPFRSLMTIYSWCSQLLVLSW